MSWGIMRWRLTISLRWPPPRCSVKPATTMQGSPCPFPLQLLSVPRGFPLFLHLLPASVQSIQHLGWRSADQPPAQKTLSLCFSSPPMALGTACVASDWAGEEKPAHSLGRQGSAVRGQPTEAREVQEAAWGGLQANRQRLPSHPIPA